MTSVRNPHVALAKAAYDRLRADLLSCRLFPGAPIQIKETSAALGTNPIAVREALSKLTSEGLVIAEHQKGFRAAPISAEALRDLTRVRTEIEASCLRSAIAHGGVDWETNIVAALHRLVRTPMRAAGDPHRANDDWAAHHARYHEALVGSCDSPMLLHIRDTLYAQSERYRCLSLPLTEFGQTAEYDRDVNREHKDIAETVMNRNVDSAIALMAAHFQKTTDMVLESQVMLREPPHLMSR